MAINTAKLLGSSKSLAIMKSSGSLASSTKSSGTLIRIQKKVIRVDTLIKNSLLLQKTKNKNEIVLYENQRLEQKEKQLEKKKPKELKGIKTPKLPGFGFLGWIKNFIFNTLLGFIAVRLIDKLPQMLNFVKIIGPAMNGIIDISGKVLNGLVTFVEKGYEAVDLSRGLVKNIGGDNALKQFDSLSQKFEQFMNLAIIVGMASAESFISASRRTGSSGAGGAAQGLYGTGRSLPNGIRAGSAEARGITSQQRIASRATQKAERRIAGAQLRAASKVETGVATKLGTKGSKAIPFLGAAVGITEGIFRIKEGDIIGGLLSFGSAIPVAGWGFLAVDVLRDLGAFEGMGLKFAGGGSVSRGRRSHSGGVQRSLSSKKQKKRSVDVTSQKVKPGSSIGGEKNIKKIFPENKGNKVANPLGYLNSSAKKLAKAGDFGPIFNIAMKTILGDKPTKLDYKKAGMGLNSWASRNITNSAAFASGGKVDARMLLSGQDMSDAIAKSIETSVSKEVDNTINDLMKQLMLQPMGVSTKETITTGQQGQMAAGSVPGGQLTIQQLVGLAKGAGFSTDEAVIMAAIALGESGGVSNKLNNNPKTGDLSYGLWQINMIGSLGPARRSQFGISNNEQLFDPVTNAKAAYSIKKSSGFVAWSVYKSGKYKNFLTQAQSAKNAPSLATSSMPTTLGTVPGNLSAAQQLASSMGLQMTSFNTGDHAKRSLHYQNRAMDFSNGTSTPQQLAFAKEIIKKYGTSIEQLIYTPLGFGISNGKQVPLSTWGQETNDQHYNHVHVAFATGGRVHKPMIALMGERGQEFVFDNDTTTGLDQMAPNLLDHLNAAKTKPELANILRSYSDVPEVILIPVPIKTLSAPVASGSKSGSTSSGSVNSYDNSWMFDRLVTGTG